MKSLDEQVGLCVMDACLRGAPGVLSSRSRPMFVFSTPRMCPDLLLSSLPQWDRLAKLAGDTPPSAVPEPRATGERIDADVNAALLESFSVAAGVGSMGADRHDQNDRQTNQMRVISSHSVTSSAASDLLAARLELEDVRRTAETIRAQNASAIAEATRKVEKHERRAAEVSQRMTEERNRMNASLKDLHAREKVLRDREDEFRERELKLPSLVHLQKQLAQREENALAAEDAATEAANEARDAIELVSDEKSAAEQSKRDAHKAQDLLQQERRKAAEDFDILEQRRVGILDELAERERVCREVCDELMSSSETLKIENKRLLSERAAIEDAYEISQRKRDDEAELVKRCEVAELKASEAEELARRAAQGQKVAEQKRVVEEEKTKRAREEFEIARRETTEIQAENESSREKIKTALSNLRSDLEKERTAHSEKLEEDRKTTTKRLDDLEEQFRRKRDDWETERRYEREELHRTKSLLEDEASIVKREKENASELVRRVESELIASREEAKQRRETENDLAARLAQITEREQTMEQWRANVKAESQKSLDEREKILKEWEDRVRSERDESRNLAASVKKERNLARQDLEVIEGKRRAAERNAEEAKDREEVSRQISEKVERDSKALQEKTQKFELEKVTVEAIKTKAASTEAECKTIVDAMTKERDSEREKLAVKEQQLERDLQRCARVERDAESTIADARRQRSEAHSTLEEANAARAEIVSSATAVDNARLEANARLEEAELIRVNALQEAEQWNAQRLSDEASIAEARAEVESARADVERLVNETNNVRHAASAELEAAKRASEGLHAVEQALTDREDKIKDTWRALRVDAEKLRSKPKSRRGSENQSALVNAHTRNENSSDSDSDHSFVSPEDRDATDALTEARELLGGLGGLEGDDATHGELGLVAEPSDSLDEDAQHAASEFASTELRVSENHSITLSFTSLTGDLLVDGDLVDPLTAVESVKTRLESSLQTSNAKLVRITHRETLLQRWAASLQREQSRLNAHTDNANTASQKLALAVRKLEHAKCERQLEYKRRDAALAETEQALHEQRSQLATVVEKLQVRESDVKGREEAVFVAGRAVAAAEQVMNSKIKALEDADGKLHELRREAQEAIASTSEANSRLEDLTRVIKEMERKHATVEQTHSRKLKLLIGDIEKADTRLKDALTAAEDAEAVFEHKAQVAEKKFGDRLKVAESRARQLEHGFAAKELETKRLHDSIIETARNEASRLTAESEAKASAIEHGATSRLRKAEVAERRLESELQTIKEFKSEKEKEREELRKERSEIRRLTEESFAEQTRARDQLAHIEEERLRLKTEERNTRTKCDAAIEKAREEGKNAEVRLMRAVAAETAAEKSLESVKAVRAECDTATRAAAEATRAADKKLAEAEQIVTTSKLQLETIATREKTCEAVQKEAEAEMRRAERAGEDGARAQREANAKETEVFQREKKAHELSKEFEATQTKVEKERQEVSEREKRVSEKEEAVSKREEALTNLSSKKAHLLTELDSSKLALVAAETKLKEVTAEIDVSSKALHTREAALKEKEQSVNLATQTLDSKLATERDAMRVEVEKLELALMNDRAQLVEDSNTAQLALDTAKQAAERAQKLEDTEAEKLRAELLQKAETEKSEILTLARRDRERAAALNQAAALASEAAEKRLIETEKLKEETRIAYQEASLAKERAEALEKQHSDANEKLTDEKTYLETKAREVESAREAAFNEARDVKAAVANVTAREKQASDTEGVLNARMKVVTEREDALAKQAAVLAETEERVKENSATFAREKALFATKTQSIQERLTALEKQEHAVQIAESEARRLAKQAADDRLAASTAREKAEQLSKKLKGDGKEAAAAMFEAEKNFKLKEEKTKDREVELREAVGRAEAEHIRLQGELKHVEGIKKKCSEEMKGLEDQQEETQKLSSAAQKSKAEADALLTEASEKHALALKTESEADLKLKAASDEIERLTELKATVDGDKESVSRLRRDAESATAVAEKAKSAALLQTEQFQQEVNKLKLERDSLHMEIKLLERKRLEADMVVLRAAEVKNLDAETKSKMAGLERREASIRETEQKLAATARTLTHQSLQVDAAKAENARLKEDAQRHAQRAAEAARVAAAAAETQARREHEWASSVTIEKAQLESVREAAKQATQEADTLRETLERERREFSQERQNQHAEFEAKLARVSVESEAKAMREMQSSHRAISHERDDEESTIYRRRREEALAGLEKARDEADLTLKQVREAASDAKASMQTNANTGGVGRIKPKKASVTTKTKMKRGGESKAPYSASSLPPRRLDLVTPANSPGGIPSVIDPGTSRMGIQSGDEPDLISADEISANKAALREKLAEAERKLRRAEHLWAGFLFADTWRSQTGLDGLSTSSTPSNAQSDGSEDPFEALRSRLKSLNEKCEGCDDKSSFENMARLIASWFGDLQSTLEKLFKNGAGIQSQKTFTSTQPRGRAVPLTERVDRFPQKNRREPKSAANYPYSRVEY